MIKLNAFERKKAVSKNSSVLPAALTLLICIFLTFVNFYHLYLKAHKTFSEKKTSSVSTTKENHKAVMFNREYIDSFNQKISKILFSQKYKGSIIKSLVYFKKNRDLNFKITIIKVNEKNSKVIVSGIISEKNLESFVKTALSDPKIEILNLENNDPERGQTIFNMALKI